MEGDFAADSSSSALDGIVVEIAKDTSAHTSFPGMQFMLTV
jgi:hypothetical protein